MIHRVTPSRHASLQSRSSCCGFNYKRELKEERKFELKPKSLARNITLSTPYRDLTIIEDELDHDIMTTPKRFGPNPVKLFASKEETATRPTTKAPTSTHKPSFPVAAIMTDDNVARPLQKLKNRRKSSHISDPLSTSCNQSIKFSYMGKADSLKRQNMRLQINEDRNKKQEAEIEQEISRLRHQLRELFAQTQRLKLQKFTNLEKYKALLFKLAKKQEEIRELQQIRKVEVMELRKELQRIISVKQEDTF